MSYYPPRYLFRRYELLKWVSEGDHFLEIGPGRLLLSVEMLRYFRRGTLIDFSPRTMEIYDTLDYSAKSRLTLMIADFMDARIKGSVDAVVACEVLEHIENEKAFLEKVHGHLKSRGRLILSVPARDSLWASDDEMAGHFRRYEKDEITSLLSGHGFRPLAVISYGFPFVNLLREARIMLARHQYAVKSHWSKDERTMDSGSILRGPLIESIGFFVNPATLWPLCFFSSLFNDRDWSDGYLIISEK
jgi:SAM-dependent methyltransferase